MSEATLAYTVHHNNGRKYSAGSTAAQIGPVAAEIGDHAWVGGKRPSTVPAPDGDPPLRTPAQSPAEGGAAETPAAPVQDGAAETPAAPAADEEAGAGAEAGSDREPPARRGRRGGGA